MLEQTIEGRDILGMTIPPFADDRKKILGIFYEKIEVVIYY